MKKIDIVLICFAVFILTCAILYRTGASPPVRTPLVLSGWLEDEAGGTLAEIIAEYERGNTSVKIIVVNKSREQIRTDCDTYLASLAEETGETERTANAPDIVTIDPLWFDDALTRRLFERRTDASRETSAPPDDQFSAPLYSHLNMLYYNIDILEKAAFDRPPKTRDEVSELCLRLKAENIVGLPAGKNFFADILPWICPQIDEAALAALNAQKDSFDFTDQNIVESIAFLGGLNSSETPDGPPEAGGEDGRERAFVEGKTAMIVASSRLLKSIAPAAERAGLRFGVTTIPYASEYSVRPMFTADSVNAAVMSGSARKEEALAFLDFLSVKRSELAAAACALPHNSAPFQTGGFFHADGTEADADTDGAESALAKARALIGSAESVEGWRLFSACASLDAIVREELAAMFASSADAASAASAIKQRYEALLLTTAENNEQ